MAKNWAPLCLGLALGLAPSRRLRAAADAGTPSPPGSARPAHAPPAPALTGASGGSTAPETEPAPLVKAPKVDTDQKSASPPSAHAGAAAPLLKIPKSDAEDKSSAKTKARAKPVAKPAKTLRSAGPVHSSTEAVRKSAPAASNEGEVVRGVESPELQAIREADRELFRPALPAAGVPWPNDLPLPLAVDPHQPIIRATGLPPAPPLAEPSSGQPVRDFGWLRTLALPDLPVRWEARVVRYLDYYRDDPRGKGQVQSWLRKSGRYGAAMRRVLREQGLPEDLIWVSLVESGLDPTIRSPAGAAGLWQLMPDGARAYGLVVDRWIDERLDAERSTEAAARYLSDLHRRFGTWELALAAYNMGYGGLLAAIRKYNTNDYWELSKLEAGIPYETALYVPKVIALAVASKNLTTFGLGSVKLDPPFASEPVTVPSGVTVRAIAAAAGVESSVIESLNPHLRAGRTPPERPSSEPVTWTVRVSVGAGGLATQALARIAEPDKKLDRYLTRLGDTVDAIATSRGTTKSRLLELNALRPEELVRPGTVLVLPAADGARPLREALKRELGKDEEKPIVPILADVPQLPGRKRVFYRVTTGDTVAEIAAAFRVTPDDLRRWNSLDPAARMHEGMTLLILADEATDLSKVAHLTEAEVRCITVGSEEFFTYFEGLRGRKRTTVVVGDGDTWEKLAKRY